MFRTLRNEMIYYLNNVRQKGMGGKHYDDVEETQFPTHIVVSADVLTRYVFRSDVAYDWEMNFGEIGLDTILQKEVHLNEFAKKHARFPSILTTHNHLLLTIHRPWQSIIKNWQR
ncbi:hypothetical protein A374_11535 [Fictibacillus macauensis ZFHKF-1]|uniref:Uncharacterized protein n=1 Tax=Fictibacillus macauensis ZFHKF-1 TaxID=1196324 RepID=I8UEX9_9BACL|nr:hypothetical protein [Fictibacillus macauensis]EIT85373.1 hypothetical protein A374_11535 [Fictibacillus macauensis ZFHKF-1]